MEHLLIVRPDGQIRFLYHDALRAFLGSGVPSIRRASHVEPTKDLRWNVDLSPLGGGTLGPFETRQEALAAEAAWINARM